VEESMVICGSSFILKMEKEWGSGGELRYKEQVEDLIISGYIVLWRIGGLAFLILERLWLLEL